MKGQHRDSAARREALRQGAQQPVQRRELVVDGNPQRLERPADGHLHLGLRRVGNGRRNRRAYRAIEGLGRDRRLPLQHAGDENGVRFIGVFG